MKKFCSGQALWLAFCLLLSIFFTGGCGESEKKAPEAKTKPTIGVLVYREDDLYISEVCQAIQNTLEDRAEVLVFYAQNDQLTQNEQFGKVIAAKVDGLAVNLVDTQAAASVVDMIKKAGIPVVFFNREPYLETLADYNKAAFVGTTTAEAGILQGKIIAELWKKHPEFDRNGDGEFQYMLFQGNADNPEALSRTEYSIRQARENGAPMYQIGQNYVCDWDINLARESMRLALTMYIDDLEIVISNNDAMALGAIEALAEKGFNLPGGPKDKFIPIVGVDAMPPAIEAINKGIMSATVKQDSKAMGQAVSSLLLNIIDGRDFLEDTPYQWDASGVAVRIPYSLLGNEE